MNDFMINFCWLLCILWTSLLVAVIHSGVPLEGVVLFLLTVSTFMWLFSVFWLGFIYLADKAGL